MNMMRKFLKGYKKFQISKSPQMNLVWSFFLYTVAGFILLSLPVFHKLDVPFIESLFISTSAISTTGLVTISVAESFNFFKQFIVMLLFQIGGIGYMTLTTFFYFSPLKKLRIDIQKS